METMPAIKKDYHDRSFDLDTSVGFMMGDHIFFRNTSRNSWEKDLLERASIAVILSNTEKDRGDECRHICCFKLEYKLGPLMMKRRSGQTRYFSYNEDYFSDSRMTIQSVQTYYDWYAQLPMQQTITIHDGQKVTLTKFASSEPNRKVDGCVYEHVHYGFEISYQKSVADSLLKAAQDFADRLLSKHTALIQRYASLVTNYQSEVSRHFRSFAEFEYNATFPMQLLIDQTGVYPRYDFRNGTMISGDERRDVLPNGCQFYQMGFPELTVIQQFGMGLAIRSAVEKNVTRMNDGTLISNTFSLRYDILEFFTNGSNGFDAGDRYISWVARVRSVLARTDRQNSW